MTPPKLLAGKQGLVAGVANDQSITWGCAKAFHALGAEVAVAYLNDKAKRFAEPLARNRRADLHAARHRTPGEMKAVFTSIVQVWKKFNFVVHSIAFAPKDAPAGPCDRCVA